MASHGACRFAGSRCLRVCASCWWIRERLGYDGIKVSLPTESTTGTCYLELYIKTILAFESEDQCNTLPLCLMLSKDTEAATRALLKEHNNFGMRADQISFVVQAGVPALGNDKAHFVLDNNEILCKPHGHGDVHSLLAQSGLPKTWLDRGLKRVFFFQDTNAFAFFGHYSQLLGVPRRET